MNPDRRFDLTDVELVKQSARILSENDYMVLGRVEYAFRVKKLYPGSWHTCMYQYVHKARLANVESGRFEVWDEYLERVEVKPEAESEPVPVSVTAAPVQPSAPVVHVPAPRVGRAPESSAPRDQKVPADRDPRWRKLRLGQKPDGLLLMGFIAGAKPPVYVKDILKHCLKVGGGTDVKWRALVGDLKRVGFLSNPEKGIYALMPLPEVADA